MPSLILRSEAQDRRILDYILTITERAKGWWNTEVSGTTLSRRDECTEYRLRMEGRRSVAQLYTDAKSEPFDGASNVGVGIEAIFAEFLIPLLLANTHDLEPMLQATVHGTKQVSDDLTTFHDNYHRYEVPEKRELLEYSTRELLTVGSCFHKWTYGRFWRHTQVDFPVWIDPLTNQPALVLDQGSGQMLPQPADPKTPPDLIPRTDLGQPMRLGSVQEIRPALVREGPDLSVRPVEAIVFPESETRPDPNLWDWVADDFEVSAYWFLGKEGDYGKLTLEALWRWLAIDPHDLHQDPIRLAQALKPIKLRAFHGKYPAASDGTPVEIVALLAVDAKILLGWQPSPFPRRPYFNRQVWHAGQSPLGKGIPETVFSMRAAMDALLNQDLDAGNLYNHPPLLLSDLAMLEDEDYETTGPGATWIMRDIAGAKFLPTPISQRDPVSLLNWLMSNTQRLWGVSDINLSAPQKSLSPQLQTLGAVREVLNQGSIKFGHLTKRLSAVDTLEYQYVHDCFRLMLANPKLVPVEGTPQRLEAVNRAQYFSEHVHVASVGNGISTNPILRQQSLLQFFTLMAHVQDPFVMGDLETRKQLDEQLLASFGLDLTLPDPPALQQSRILQDLMQTPEGQQALPAVMQQVLHAVQARALLAPTRRTNGAPSPVTGQ